MISISKFIGFALFFSFVKSNYEKIYWKCRTQIRIELLSLQEKEQILNLRNVNFTYKMRTSLKSKNYIILLFL